MIPLRQRKSLAVLALCFALPLTVWAQDYYVAMATNGGSDSNPGTIDSPFLTVGHAVGQMAPGDTILVRGGTYGGFVVGPPYSSTGLSWDHPNTLKAFPGEKVTFHNPSSDNVILFNGIIGGITNQYWILKDFIVDGTDGLLTSGASGSALIDGGGDYVRIENVELAYGPRSGIASGGSYWELINLNVHHARTLASDDTGHGVYWRGQHLLIDGGQYHDNTGYGIQSYNGGNIVSHTIIRNAKIFNNGTGHLRPHQHGVGGVVLGSGSDNIIYNSLIYGNFGNGIDIDYRCGLYEDNLNPSGAFPCKSFNNTFYGNEGAIALGNNDAPMCNPFSSPPGQPCVHAIVENNIVWGSGIHNTQSISTIDHNLNADPSFVDAANGNFTLQARSPALGQGINLTNSGITADFARNARPPTGAWDIGAYQNSSLNTGKVFFVATDGNDNNPGTMTSPFQSIQHCINIMAAKDTCYVRGGTYDTKDTGFVGGGLRIGSGVSASGTDFGTGAIMLKAFNNEPVIVKNTFYGSDYMLMFTGANLYWIIDGLIFDGTGQTRTGGSASALIGGDGSYVRLQNCEVKNGVSSGLEPIGDHWELLNLNVHGNGTQVGVQFHGIYWSGNHLLIDGGSYHDNWGYGIHIFYTGHTDISDNVVRNTRIYGNGINPATGGGGIILSCGSNNVAYNNLIYLNNGPALQIDYRCTNCAAYNNSVTGNSGPGFYIDGSGTYVLNAVVKNNIVFNNYGDGLTGGTNSTFGNNLTTNPKYADPPSGDFHLLSNSAALGAGENLSSLFTTDLDGNPRPGGSMTWDLGAYQGSSIYPYTCPGGIACDGASITGTPDQQVCGSDLRFWTCTASGWQGPGTPCTCGGFNQPPTVNAGPDQTINLLDSVNLAGQASDDGLPQGNLLITWSKVSGPGSVNFANSAALNTTAGFSAAGNYVLRLTANDHALTATDDITIVVTTAYDPADVVWVEDRVPTGGQEDTYNGDSWNWISSNPSPFSGNLAHQSNLFNGMHQHFFYGATDTLTINQGDILFAYIYIDPSNPPTGVELQWNENGSWEHRAYWSLFVFPDDVGTASLHYMGTVPPIGQWVRLEVPASAVGLEGKVLNGMAFTLYGGRATWDRAGKAPLVAPEIISPKSVQNTVATALTYQIRATHFPTNYNATSLPGGLSVNTNTGLITGTPMAPGVFNVTISATNAVGTTTMPLTLTVTMSSVDPVGWWKLDEAKGATSFADASGNGNTGTCIGSACPAAGVSGAIGTATAFDGVNDMVMIPDSPVLDLNTMSIALWVKPGKPAADATPLIAKEAPDGGQRNYGLFILPNTLNLVFSFQATDCSTYNSFYNTHPLTPNSWNHIAVTYSGYDYKLYINGALDETQNVSSSMCQNNFPVRLGAQLSAYVPFNGGEDDVRIYNRPLNSIEVQALYNAMPHTSRCDLNSDNATNSADVTLLTNAIMTNTNPAAYDLNRDGKVNVLDAQILSNVVTGAGTCPP